MKTRKQNISRKQAAIELNAIYNGYEVRKNSVSTTYKKIYFDKVNNAWRLIGYAHDYSLSAVSSTTHLNE